MPFGGNRDGKNAGLGSGAFKQMSVVRSVRYLVRVLSGPN